VTKDDLTSEIGTSPQLTQCNEMSGVEGGPEVTDFLSRRRE
jgi:hypothetical protein